MITLPTRLNSTQLPVELSWVELSRVGRYDKALTVNTVVAKPKIYVRF